MAMSVPKFKIDISRCIFLPHEFLCSAYNIDVETRKKSHCLSCTPYLIYQKYNKLLDSDAKNWCDCPYEDNPFPTFNLFNRIPRPNHSEWDSAPERNICIVCGKLLLTDRNLKLSCRYKAQGQAT